MQKSTEVLHESPIPTICVTHAGEYHAPAGRHFPAHAHTGWEFVYYRTGSITCTIAGVPYATQPGTVLATPPGTLHSEEAHTGYSHYYLLVEALPDAQWPVVFHDDSDRSLGRLFLSMMLEHRERRENGEQMMALLAAQLTIMLARCRTQPEQSSAQKIVGQAESLMQERFATQLTIGQLAREVGVSASSLRDHFHAHRGCSPMARLQSIRTAQALSLIQSSTLTLEHIASVCGYDSASHLSRRIKQATGRSPGALRRAGLSLGQRNDNASF